LLEQRLKQRDGDVTVSTSKNVALVAKQELNYTGNVATASGGKKSRKTFDKKKVRCFKCNLYGHFASECKSTNTNSSVRGNKNTVAMLLMEAQPIALLV